MQCHPGTLLGHNRYQLQQRIFEDGPIQYWSAVDKFNQSTDYLKVIQIILPIYSRHVQRYPQLQTQIEYAHLLKSQHIAFIEHTDINNDPAFVVLDLADGNLLFQILRRSLQQGFTISWPLATYIMLQICNGLFCSHTTPDPLQQENFIIHGDLRPESIFLTANGEVKLLPFGQLNLWSDLRDAWPDTVKRRYAYAAPERWMEEGQHIDPRADLFALGVLFYELLTGYLPYDGENAEVLQKQMLFSAPPLLRQALPDAPPQIETIIYHLLQLTPSNRLPSINHLLPQLNQVLQSIGDYQSLTEQLAQIARQSSFQPIISSAFSHGSLSTAQIYSSQNDMSGSSAASPFTSVSDPLFIKQPNRTIDISSSPYSVSPSSSVDYMDADELIEEIFEEEEFEEEEQEDHGDVTVINPNPLLFFANNNVVSENIERESKKDSNISTYQYSESISGSNRDPHTLNDPVNEMESNQMGRFRPYQGPQSFSTPSPPSRQSPFLSNQSLDNQNIQAHRDDFWKIPVAGMNQAPHSPIYDKDHQTDNSLFSQSLSIFGQHDLPFSDPTSNPLELLSNEPDDSALQLSASDEFMELEEEGDDPTILQVPSVKSNGSNAQVNLVENITADISSDPFAHELFSSEQLELEQYSSSSISSAQKQASANFTSPEEHQAKVRSSRRSSKPNDILFALEEVTDIPEVSTSSNPLDYSQLSESLLSSASLSDVQTSKKSKWPLMIIASLILLAGGGFLFWKRPWSSLQPLPIATNDDRKNNHGELPDLPTVTNPSGVGIKQPPLKSHQQTKSGDPDITKSTIAKNTNTGDPDITKSTIAKNTNTGDPDITKSTIAKNTNNGDPDITKSTIAKNTNTGDPDITKSTTTGITTSSDTDIAKSIDTEVKVTKREVKKVAAVALPKRKISVESKGPKKTKIKRKRPTQKAAKKTKVAAVTPKISKKPVVASSGTGMTISIQPTCTLYLKKKELGKSYPARFFNLEPGNHSMTCINQEKKIIHQFNLLIISGQQVSYNRILRSGEVIMTSNPWSDIYIPQFGKVGKTGDKLTMYEGRYEVQLYKQGSPLPTPGFRQTIWITVRPGRLTRPNPVSFPILDDE
jgi:hypothetical protein